MSTNTEYINACAGLSLKASDIATLLKRMSLVATVADGDADDIVVDVPATRPDILHACDIMEDAAIAYGFNNIPRTFPNTSTVAQSLAVSKISDLIRREWVSAGWVEVLPFILVSVVSAKLKCILIDICSVHMKRTLLG